MTGSQRDNFYILIKGLTFEKGNLRKWKVEEGGGLLVNSLVHLFMIYCLFIFKLFFLVTPGGMPDLSFLTRDQTGATCSGVYGLVNFIKIISASRSFRKPFFFFTSGSPCVTEVNLLPYLLYIFSSL